jgi:hypothetical protein
LQRLDKPARFLYNVLVRMDQSIEINLEIFGYVNKEAVTWLLKEDLIDVFKGNWVSMTVLQVFSM